MIRFLTRCLITAVLTGLSSSGPAESSIDFDQETAAVPETHRAEVKRLMMRRPPVVGEVAPDFTLPTLDDQHPITRSQFQKGRPLVLVFGSFT
jgi:hypothetical protein